MLDLIPIPTIRGDEIFVNPRHIQAISDLPTPVGGQVRSQVIVYSGACLQVAGTPREVLDLIKQTYFCEVNQ